MGVDLLTPHQRDARNRLVWSTLSKIRANDARPRDALRSRASVRPTRRFTTCTNPETDQHMEQEERIRDLELDIRVLRQLVAEVSAQLFVTQQLVRREFGFDAERWRQETQRELEVTRPQVQTPFDQVRKHLGKHLNFEYHWKRAPIH